MYRIFIIAITLLCSVDCHATSSLEKLRSLPAASLLLVDENNQALYTKNPNQPYIPASTVKLLTSLIALDYWGKDHQFFTDFYFDKKDNILWVKGYGDPYLISEELDLVVRQIKAAGITELDGIGVDTSYFQKSVLIDEGHKSSNPYDAPAGALAANFNTINVRIYDDAISSSEPQTPLTPLARELAQSLSVGEHRINLGKSIYGPKYFAELLKAKLNRSGIPTDMSYQHGAIPQNSEFLFSYKNSHTLEQVIRSMLEFSNNFIANQLYLIMGAELYKPPANMEKANQVAKDYIKQHFGWKNYNLVDGAGLSKDNRLSAQQLIDILEKFKPYRQLLPTKNPNIFAKSGTLKNVSTYAGYIKRKDYWSPFAIMINQGVNFTFREEVAKELLE